MARQRDYEKLGKLKKQKKELEGKIKTLEREIFSNNPKQEIPTEYGTLKLSSRQETWVPDNHHLIANSSITYQMFTSNAKINKTALKKLISEEELQHLLDEDVINQGTPTNYYTLK